MMEPWLQSISSNLFPGSLVSWQTEWCKLQVWDQMVWVLLKSWLLLWLVALIESMMLSVPVSHPWRIKSAISIALYIPVTKHINPLKILLLSGRNPRRFWGKVYLFVCLFNQSLSQIKLLPNQMTPWQLGYQADVPKGELSRGQSHKYKENKWFLSKKFVKWRASICFNTDAQEG